MRSRLLSMLAVFLAGSFVWLIGFGQIASAADNIAPIPAGQKPKVVATISIIGDWVKTVGGENVDLKTLVGRGGYWPKLTDGQRNATDALLVSENLHRPALGADLKTGHWLGSFRIKGQAPNRLRAALHLAQLVFGGANALQLR